MMRLLCLSVLIALAIVVVHSDEDDEDFDPYTTMDPAKREPHPCEICKYFVTELVTRLEKSGRSKEVIETGHGLEKKKRFKYSTSELRFTEALLEPHICDKIIEYNVHAERKGSLRYAKGMSETFETLHGLVDKGVKVDLGIPYDLWDKPSAEVTKMQRWCYNMAEEYEDDIEYWYYNMQDKASLPDYICRDRYLKHKKADASCLDEKFEPKGDTEVTDDGKKKKKKKKKGKSKKSKKGDIGSDDIQGHEPSQSGHEEL